MATARQLSDSLQCPICQELLSKPKLLPCSHSFCESCLKQLHSIKKLPVNISCPVCRQVAHVPGNNVCNFPTNQIAKSLAEDFKKQSDTKARSGKRHEAFSGQPCTVCDGNDRDRATYYCQNCSEFLCDHCLQQHKKYKRNTFHEVVKARAIQSGIVKIKFACPDHPQELQQFVCITCLDRICCRCLEVGHQSDIHDVIGIEEYEKSHKAAVDSLQEKIEQKTAVIQSNSSFVKEQIGMVQNIIGQQRREMKNVYEGAHEQLREWKDQMVEECDTYERSLCEYLEGIIEFHDDSLENLSAKVSEVTEKYTVHCGDQSLTERIARVKELKALVKIANPDTSLAESITLRAESLTFHQVQTVFLLPDRWIRE